MGVGRGVPAAPEVLLKRKNQQIKDARQSLKDYSRRLEQKSDAEEHLVRELQQERERRLRAESQLGQPPSGAAVPSVAKQAHALPEPDETISRRRIFRSLISPLKPGKMLDLGAGPGHFSLIAAQLGWEVTAVDARNARTPDPEAEEDPERARLIRSVKWIEADVREFLVRDGEYDLICVFGLLHRLGLDDQIKLLKHCSVTLTLLDTRIAPEIVVTEGLYEGLYKHEPGETPEERDEIPWAAWGNELSLIHTEESLLRLLRGCGYGKAMGMKPPHSSNYTFYLCLPSPK